MARNPKPAPRIEPHAEASPNRPHLEVGPLGRDAILAAEDLPSDDVEVPQWGGKVRVRSMSGAQRLVYERSCEKLRRKGAFDVDGSMKVIALLVIHTAIGGDGKPLFEEQDLKRLLDKNFDAVGIVFEKAALLNGMRKKDVEDLAGN
jgi:hypothetical protein